eukprot:GHVR01113315.1.p1 GENE.GHVR01113315.1~~GHVR01113315.1.p1  ORF type:complete len:157 (-),score=42.67 GHVR01113315.1:194-664(-)
MRRICIVTVVVLIYLIYRLYMPEFTLIDNIFYLGVDIVWYLFGYLPSHGDGIIRQRKIIDLLYGSFPQFGSVDIPIEMEFTISMVGLLPSHPYKDGCLWDVIGSNDTSSDTPSCCYSGGEDGGAPLESGCSSLPSEYIHTHTHTHTQLTLRYLYHV